MNGLEIVDYYVTRDGWLMEHGNVQRCNIPKRAGCETHLGTPPEGLEPEPIIHTDYPSLRYAEYPNITEQLDAIWKGGEAMEEMRARIFAVKAKYPKT